MAWAVPLGSKRKPNVPPRQKVFSHFWREFPTLLTWTHEDEMSIFGHHPVNDSESCIRLTKLGSGASGDVYKVLRVKEGAIVAGKHTKDNRKMALEAQALQKHAHPHILRFEGMYTVLGSPDQDMLLTELCGGGTLQELIDRNPYGVQARDVLLALDQLSRALDWLHGRGFFHTDFKPGNVFVRSYQPLNLVLGDMGDVQSVDQEQITRMGTRLYWSPDIWHGDTPVGPVDDIWALGITCLALYGQLPDVDRFVSYNKRYKDRKGFPYKCIRHVKELQRLNPEHPLVDLVAGMLKLDLEHRFTAGYIIQEVAYLLHCWEWKTEWDAANLDIQSPNGFRPRMRRNAKRVGAST